MGETMKEEVGRGTENRGAGVAARWVMIGAACLAAVAARAWDSPGSEQRVPPHTVAWIDTGAADPLTVFHWRFSPAHERTEEAWETLMDPAALVAAKEPAALAIIPAKQPEPLLQGDARLAPGEGRFGGGLAVAGGGHAKAVAELPALLEKDGGFTLDLWFKAAAAVAEGASEVLLAVADARGRPWVSVARTAAGAALVCDDNTLAEIPVAPAVDQWHHLVFVLHAGRGAASATLIVGDQRVEAVALPGRMRAGTAVYTGGAPERPGLRGWVDEIRLSRGRRYFYEPLLFAQEQGAEVVETPVGPPFFRQSRVDFRCRFDGTLDPDAFSGTRWQGRAEEKHFQRGIRGQALDLTQADTVGFSLLDVDIFPNLRGTIEFWFRPLDWNNFYVADYHGVNVKSLKFLGLRPKNAMRHNSLGHGNATKGQPTKEVSIRLGRSGGAARQKWTKLHPGTWTHVVIAVWGREREQNVVYLNGIPRGHLGVQFFDSIYGGVRRADDKLGPGALSFYASRTLVDEFAAYPWVMNREEAWNAYARWLPDAAAQMRPLPPFKVNFSYAAHNWKPGHEQLNAHVVYLLTDAFRPVSAALELCDADGKTLHRSDAQKLDGNGVTAFTAVGSLPFGRYTVRVRALDAAGAVVQEDTAEYERVRPEWYGNTLGTERSVPEPWVPMTVDGQTVRLWGRELVLGADGLPARITTLDRQVLAAPVSVAVTGPSGAAALAGSGVTFTETAADRVAWRATLAGGGVRAELDASMEFDGLLYCAVTLRPAGGAAARVDALQVDFPMNPAHTAQLVANGGGDDFRKGWDARLIPAAEGRVWDGLTSPPAGLHRALKNFLPHLWLGGDTVGLYFGGENDQGWTIDGKQPAQEVIRRDGAVVFRMNVIREPVDLGAEGHRFHFVLLPTPAKPEPPDWRARMRVDRNAAKPRYWFGAMDIFGGFNLNEDPENPGGGVSALEPRCWDHAAAMSAELREKWGMTILMANASWPKPGPAFKEWNHDLWAGTGRVAWTPELIDYTVWAINQYLERDVIDGIYFDDVSVGRTLSLAAGAYELPDGTRRVGFTALAQRRLLMRLWRLFLAHGKEPDLGLHMTFCYEVPLFSFVRYLFNGEVFARANYQADFGFMDMWPPDLLRLLGGACKWGTGVQWVTVGTEGKDAQWVFLQNRSLDGNYMSADVLAEGVPHGALIQAGMLAPGVRAYPFWASHEVVRVQAPEGADVRAAVYAHADRAYVVLTNFSRKEHEAGVEALAERLFPQAAGRLRWRDADPGLAPPRQNAARGAQLPKAPQTLLDGEAVVLADEQLTDMLDGTSPEQRLMQRLAFPPREGGEARVLIRPRDYRVLEVRPMGGP